MESVADFKEECQPQSLERLKASIRTRISIWVRASGIWGVGALTYFVQKANLRAREYSRADHHSGEIKLAGKSKQLKDSGGVLSLVLELLGAIAIRLLQRYLKCGVLHSIVKLRNPPESSAGLPRKAVPTDRNTLLDHRSEISPQNAESEKPYQKGVVALFQNTTSEWIQDKCPQLGAALAYFTVFSLAPLVLVLLAVFGLIFGASDHARQKIMSNCIVALVLS